MKIRSLFEDEICSRPVPLLLRLRFRLLQPLKPSIHACARLSRESDGRPSPTTMVPARPEAALESPRGLRAKGLAHLRGSANGVRLAAGHEETGLKERLVARWELRLHLQKWA